MNYAGIEAAAHDAGLDLRGGFEVRDEDEVPAGPAGQATRTLILLGNAGARMWKVFGEELAHPGPLAPTDPPQQVLDEWSLKVIDQLAQDLGGWSFYPFGGPPYRPFIRWAQRAEPVYPSPIGPLIHPEYGLWHAYRGAVGFSQLISLPSPSPSPSPSASPSASQTPSPCDTCTGKPCLSTCPVAAFQPGNYDVPSCVTHVSSSLGEDCLRRGCLARRACPVGAKYRYAEAQAHFHMAAFVRSVHHRSRSGD